MKKSVVLTVAMVFLAFPAFFFVAPAAGTDLVGDLVGLVADRLFLDGNVSQDAFIFENVRGSGDINRQLFGFFPAPEFWTVDQGRVEIAANGDFFADIFGLRADGLTVPRFEIAALIVCEDGRLAHDTGFFRSDELGDVFISDFVVLPLSCFSPTVLFVDFEDFLIAAAGSEVGF